MDITNQNKLFSYNTDFRELENENMMLRTQINQLKKELETIRKERNEANANFIENQQLKKKINKTMHQVQQQQTIESQQKSQIHETKESESGDISSNISQCIQLDANQDRTDGTDSQFTELKQDEQHQYDQPRSYIEQDQVNDEAIIETTGTETYTIDDETTADEGSTGDGASIIHDDSDEEYDSDDLSSFIVSCEDDDGMLTADEPYTETHISTFKEPSAMSISDSYEDSDIQSDFDSDEIRQLKTEINDLM